MGGWVRAIAPLRSAATFLCLTVAISCQVTFAQSNPSSALGPDPSSAPNPARGPLITLKDAVQLVLKQNPQVLIARLLSLESDRNRQIARSALLPQATLAAGGAVVQYKFQSIEKAP